MAKSFDEIYAEKQAKTAAKHGMTVDELNDKLTDTDVGDTVEPTTEVDEQPEVDEQDDVQFLKDQVSKLTSQLSAMKGRVGPEQQRVAALENTLNMVERQYKSQIADMQSKLDEANRQIEQRNMESFSVDDVLSEEDREMIDPMHLDIIKKVAVATAKRFAPQTDVSAQVKSILETERENQVNAYRESILGNPRNPSSRIMTLADDPEFKEWSESNPDVKFTVGALLNAKATADVDAAFTALNKRIKDYDDQKRSKKHTPKTDTVTSSLETAMRRDGTGTDEVKRKSELESMSRQLKELARSGKRNSQEARDLFNKIQSF